MGKRREPRLPRRLGVRIFGTDLQGRIFSENVYTLDISNYGVRLSGVRPQLRVDEIVGLTYRQHKAHFRVRWTGTPGTPREGQVGLLNLTPERPLWDIALPHRTIDPFRPESMGERRRAPRVKCSVSVELRANGEPPMWGKASDISVGGCFVEMPIPLKPDTEFEISLWLSDTKLKLRGSVACSSPGFGIGVRFLEVRKENQELLSRFIQGITTDEGHQASVRVAATGVGKLP